VIDSTDSLERPKLVAVPVIALSLWFPFCGGNVVRKLGVYFTVEPTNNTWRQWTHNEVCVVFAWRATMLVA
jgi:hypothetical protein